MNIILLLLLGQAAAQQCARLVQPPFDGGNGERQEIGDARNRPLVVVAQFQHRAVFRPERRQRLGYLFVLAAARVFLGRAGAQFAAVGKKQRVHLRRGCRFGALGLACHTPRPVPGDGAQPARKLARFL